MNIGAIPPHVWFSIFVVLATGGIAVLATLLKSRNDRLRDILIELRSRHEEDQRRLSYERMKSTRHAAAPPASAAPAAVIPPAPVPAAAPVAAPVPVAAIETTSSSRASEVRDRNIAMRRAEERAMDFATRQGRRRHPGPAPESLPKLDDMNPKEALSDWLNKRAAARASHKTTAVPEPRPAAPEPAPLPAPVATQEPEPPVALEPEAAPQAAVELELAPAAVDFEPAHAAPEPKQPAVFIDEFLWDSILGKDSKPRFEVIQGAATGLPAGMHDQAALYRLLESNKPFHGLAVAVGFSLNDGRAVSKDVILHIEQLVRGILRDGEFACQNADDSFLLLSPGKQGAEAQRRLSDISERFWDFQLRGAGNFSVMFNTADVRVDNEPLRQAVATASARLQQARRARKAVAIESGSSRKASSAAV